MFRDLVGNAEVKEMLRRLLSSERMPHSYIFAGDEGVGKMQFAIETARGLLCTQAANGEGCGECPQCRRAGEFAIPAPDKKDEFERLIFSRHPDLGLVMPYKRNVRVDAIRHLEREANYRPYEGNARVFIVDDADKMNDSAANALLKTLEEPASTTYIFLLTARPDTLLPTIRSRCQMIRFGPISADAIENFLVEKMAFATDEARLASRLGRGSIGRAASIKVAEYRNRRDKMLSVINAAAALRDRAELLSISEELSDAKSKDHFEENIVILESLVHDVWTLAVGGGTERLINADLAHDLSSFADEVTPSDARSWMDAIAELRRGLDVNINRRVATDALFVAMASGR
jgi:DNA polymerase III subunit delta'